MIQKNYADLLRRFRKVIAATHVSGLSWPETIAESVRKVNGIIHIIASRKFLKNRQESIKVATLVKFILPKTPSFFAAHPPLNWGRSDICKNIAEKTRLGWESILYTVLCSTALYIFSKLDGISVLVLPDQNRFSLLLVRLAWNLNKPKFLSHGDLLESVIYLKTVHPMWPVTAKCLQFRIQVLKKSGLFFLIGSVVEHTESGIPDPCRHRGPTG